LALERGLESYSVPSGSNCEPVLTISVDLWLVLLRCFVVKLNR